MITFYWSRRPGNFVRKETGEEVRFRFGDPGPKFTGTVREWYETLIETIIDVSNKYHREAGTPPTPRTLVTSPEIATIFERSVLFKPYMKAGEPCPTCGRSTTIELDISDEHFGTVANMFDVKIDRSLPRNMVKVGDIGKVIVLDMNPVKHPDDE
jgi:hypothetical protein